MEEPALQPAQHEAVERRAALPLLHILHHGTVVRSSLLLHDSKGVEVTRLFQSWRTDIIVIITRAGAITSRRRTRHLNAAEPGPKQLQRAQRKLSTVTACSTLRGPPNPDRNATGSRGKPEGDDVEATAAQLEMGEWSVLSSQLQLPLRMSNSPPAVQTAMPAQPVQGRGAWECVCRHSLRSRGATPHPLSPCCIS